MGTAMLESRDGPDLTVYLQRGLDRVLKHGGPDLIGGPDLCMYGHIQHQVHDQVRPIAVC